MLEAALDEKNLGRALAGRYFLLTGHTGFKGGWLALWLRRPGADTTALALLTGDGQTSLIDALNTETLVHHRVADIRSPEAFPAAVQDLVAELVTHMATTVPEHPGDLRLTIRG